VSALPAHLRQHWRRNWLAFFGDYVGFGIGLIFANAATTLPAFAAGLTSNKVLIGAASSLWVGGWLLPQLFAAHYLTGQPRKYPVMMTWEYLGRPAFLLFVVWLLAGGARYPALTLGLFLLSIVIFRASDALVALAYWDLLGRAMPVNRRGRLFGMGQLTTGLAAVGAGLLIQRVLGPAGPGYPLNYAILFALAALGFTISTVACAFIVEVPEAAEPPVTRTSLRAYLPQLGRLWRADRRFNTITGVRVLSGAGALATSFYVVYATDVLRLPPSAVGLFTFAATGGMVAAGLLLGPLADRYGPRRVVQVVTWAQFLTPVLALLCHLGVFGPAVGVVFPLLFALLGVYEGSYMLGFNSFLLEIAPPGQRANYMGLANTFSSVLIFMPVAGGLLLQGTSYPVLFVAASAVTLSAALLALGLPASSTPVPEPGGALPSAETS
jgi:hypothetical protein